MLPLIGLSLVVIGWIEQVYRSLSGKHVHFSPFFLTFFLIGTAILAYDRFNQADIVIGSMFAFTTALAFTILMILLIRSRKPGTF